MIGCNFLFRALVLDFVWCWNGELGFLFIALLSCWIEAPRNKLSFCCCGQKYAYFSAGLACYHLAASSPVLITRKSHFTPARWLRIFHWCLARNLSFLNFEIKNSGRGTVRSVCLFLGSCFPVFVRFGSCSQSILNSNLFSFATLTLFDLLSSCFWNCCCTIWSFFII